MIEQFASAFEDVQVVICMATFYRPELFERAFKSLVAQQAPFPFAILVCDNSPLGDANQIDMAYRGAAAECLLVHEPRPGISAARERLFQVALDRWPKARWLAVMDDDEVAAPDWLQALIVSAEKYAADIVEGWQIYDTPGDAPNWLRSLSDEYGRMPKMDGPYWIASTFGNALISTSLLRRMRRPFFDSDFGISGNSDYEFYTRARAEGAKFARTSHAKTFEMVTDERLNFDWWRARYRKTGFNYFRIHRKHRSFIVFAIREFITASKRIVLAAVEKAVHRDDFRRRKAALRLAWVEGQWMALRGQTLRYYRTDADAK